MKSVFADTSYWIAILNPKDDLHSRAKQANEKLDSRHIHTTDSVLIELLNYFCERGSRFRMLAAASFRKINSDADVTVVPQTREILNQAVILYTNRSDKQYSLTDCISMETMRKLKLLSILTSDAHFAHEGFHPLLRV